MNILFGCLTTSGGADALIERAQTALQKWFPQSPPASVYGATASMALGVLSDGGAVLGQAHSDSLTLAFLGSIENSPPGWSAVESPLDHPDTTARHLLELYSEQGLAGFASVFGQYVLIVVDHANSQLEVISDPSGQRGWFYHSENGQLIFATHLATLGAMLGEKLTIDRIYEDFFLMHGFYPFNHTCYRGIRSLPSKKLLRGTADGVVETSLELAAQWDGRDPGYDRQAPQQEQVVDALYDAFMDALREQLPGDERVAVLLGGFDSALVAAALHRLGKRVETFSFYYQETQYNQPHTDTLAEHLSIKHHWVPITQDIFREGLDRFAFSFNQPTNWPNYVIQTAHLCSVIRSEGIRYCYSGDGCDTVFLGYPGTYKRAVLLNALPTLPRQLVRVLIGLFGHSFLDRALGHPYRVMLNMLRSLGRDSATRGFVSFRILDEISLRSLRAESPPTSAEPTEEILRRLAQPHAELPPLRRAYLGKSLVSPNKNKIVGSSDQNGVAILSPYLHAGMKRFAAELPVDILRPMGEEASKVTGKYILMRMAEDKGLLPREVIHQPKMAAVDGPIDDWYEGPLNPLMQELLSDLPFQYSSSYLTSILKRTSAERLFRDRVMTDKVISHAASLLVTYARFSQLLK